MTADSWDPGQYAKFLRERSAPFFDLLDLVEPRPGMRVVDLGCGTGELTRQLHERLGARETLGLDRSAKMLEKSAAFAAPGLRFEQGTVEEFAPGRPLRPRLLERRPPLRRGARGALAAPRLAPRPGRAAGRPPPREPGPPDARHGPGGRRGGALRRRPSAGTSTRPTSCPSRRTPRSSTASASPGRRVKLVVYTPPPRVAGRASWSG